MSIGWGRLRGPSSTSSGAGWASDVAAVPGRYPATHRASTTGGAYLGPDRTPGSNALNATAVMTHETCMAGKRPPSSSRQCDLVPRGIRPAATGRSRTCCGIRACRSINVVRLTRSPPAPWLADIQCDPFFAAKTLDPTRSPMSRTSWIPRNFTRPSSAIPRHWPILSARPARWREFAAADGAGSMKRHLKIGPGSNGVRGLSTTLDLQRPRCQGDHCRVRSTCPGYLRSPLDCHRRHPAGDSGASTCGTIRRRRASVGWAMQNSRVVLLVLRRDQRLRCNAPLGNVPSNGA